LNFIVDKYKGVYMSYLPETELVKVTATHTSPTSASFEIEPLLPGYGHTLGNALRRVLLSSLQGTAITSIRVNDTNHEFTSADGVKEDVIEIILNIKSVRILYSGSEPVTISLDVKGDKSVTAADFKVPAGVEIINKDQVIAHVDKGNSLQIEAIVETGRGYVPTEKRDRSTLPIGMIAIDSIFTPIKKINYTVTNTRVGQATDFDKIILEIETDGSIDPSTAFKTASEILSDHIAHIHDQIEIKNNMSKPSRSKKTKKTEVKEESTT